MRNPRKEAALPLGAALLLLVSVSAAGAQQEEPAPDSVQEQEEGLTGELSDELVGRRAAALLALRAGRIVDAVDLLDQLLAAAPDRADLHLLQGHALARPSPVQDLAEADRELATAERLGVAEAAVWRAAIAVRRASFAEARALLAGLASRRAELELPARVHALILEARLASEEGALAPAREHLAAALELGRQGFAAPAAAAPLVDTLPESLLEGRALHAEVLLASGETAAACDVAARLVEQYRDDASFRRLYASCLRGSEAEPAAAAQERAAELLAAIEGAALRQPIEEIEPLFAELDRIEPRSPRNPLRLARACLERRLYRKTVELCQAFRNQVYDGRPHNRLVAEAWYVEGRANLTVPEYLPRAAECFRNAARFSPDFAPECQRLLHEIEARLGAGR